MLANNGKTKLSVADADQHHKTEGIVQSLRNVFGHTRLDFAVLEETRRKLVGQVKERGFISLLSVGPKPLLGSLEGEPEPVSDSGVIALGHLESREGRAVLVRVANPAAGPALHAKEKLALL